MRLASCGAQSLIILELPIQKEIVPASLQTDRDVDVANARAEINGFPIVVLGAARNRILERARGLLNDNAVSLVEWDMAVGLLEVAFSLLMR